MNRWRLPLRLARREVFRRPGRTALVALLVAIPVAGMALAVTLIRSAAETPEESWQQRYGLADAVFEDFAAGVLSDLPNGSRTIDVQKTYARMKATDGRRADADVSDLPLDDPMAEGIYDLVVGRPAQGRDEVVISTALADDLDVHLGEQLRLARPPFDARVVGEVEPVGCLGCGALLLPPGAERADSFVRTFSGGQPTTTLIDLPDGLSLNQLAELRDANHGQLFVREFDLLNDSADAGADGVRWSLVLGAVVLTVVAIVISAAFAVGARRQLVTLGQLSASGAPASTVRAALVLQGTVTGIVGAVGGLLLAAAVLLRFEGALERLLDQRIDGYDVRAVELFAVVAIGVAAATAAALIPARTAARIPTLAALAGRRPLPPVSRRLLTWGIGGVAVGLGLLFLAVLGSESGRDGDVWAFVAIVGGVAELLGACAISPAIVARLEPASARLRGALRLGARSLARHRARTGAVVSAVTAAAALAVVSGALVLAAEEQSSHDGSVPDDLVVLSAYPHDPFADRDAVVPDELRDEVLDLVPGARVVSTGATQLMLPDVDPADPKFEGIVFDGLWDAAPVDRSINANVGASSERALVASEALLDAIDAPDAVRDGLEEHGVVVLSTQGGGGYEGDATILLPDLREVPGVSVRHDHVPAYESSYLITEERAEELELDTSESIMIIEAPQPLTADQRGELQDLQWDLDSASSVQTEAEMRSQPLFIQLSYEEPDSGPTPFQVELILTGVALVFALFVVGVSLALAAAESKDERDILTIAGAPPNALARSAGARAWLLSIIGAVMAVPVGFLPVIVVSWASAQNDEGHVPFPIVFPTRTVLLLVVALPLAVSAVSWLASSTSLRLRPVRISTATFE